MDSKLRYSQKLENAIALIISCTRRIKRPVDLVTLVKNILFAKRCMGSLEAVAESVGLSVQQLKDFLAVEDLCKEVKILVAKRAIDSVDLLKTIRGLPVKKQKILARHFVRGDITSKDVRSITTHSKKFPDKPIEHIILDYEKSKDIRLYVAEFILPPPFNNRIGLRRRLEEIVGKKEIKKLQFKERSAVLEVTSLGYKKLREAVKKRKMTLRKFVLSVVEEITRRK